MTLERSPRRSDGVVIENARVVTPTEVVDPGCVVVEDGRICAVVEDGTRSSVDAEGSVDSVPAERIDADRQLVLPGLVDLHGDDIERHLFPRSEAQAPMTSAFTACDRANVAAGITTKFHAIAFENAPDERRSVDLSQELVAAIENAPAGTQLLDHRVHARCELGDEGAIEAVRKLVENERTGLVSLMNHLPGEGQFEDWQAFSQRYLDGAPEAEQHQVLQHRQRTDGAIGENVLQLVEAARETGTPVASHDDGQSSDVERADAHGISISEYPVTMEAARHAASLGMITVMGSPNLVRGESLWGNLSASAAIDAGIVDVLCSDYRPASMLESIFVDTGESLPVRVARVTERPADVVGLDDRGRITEGARADLILVDREEQPTVSRALVDGREVYRANGRC